MKKIKKRFTPRSKKPKRYDKFDEEISEDEDVFDDLDTNKNRKVKRDDEVGELWKYIHENEPGDDPYEEGHENTEIPSINGNKEYEDEEIKSDNDFVVDRLEGSSDLTGTILDYDQLEDDDPSYKWITQSSESNETYKRLIRKFRQVEADVPEVLKSESQAKTRRLERKTQYESVNKHLTKKWAPIVSHINKTEGLVYGEETDRSDPTCGTLYSTFKPETDFEKELAKSNDEKLKLIEEKALARAVLAREQKKNKRINRIKSKRWHKRQKQRDLEIAAKLLTKIDDPDLAEEIKSTFERKRAEKRILRKKEAQSKWAKMALRYGGKDLLKEISFQNQNLKNDHQLIDEVTKYRKENEEDETDDSDSESSEDGEQVIRETNQEKLNVILDSSVPIPEKGLFNLTFMKNAIENRRLQEQNKSQKNSSDYGDEDYDEQDEHVDANENNNTNYNDKEFSQSGKDDENETIDYNIIINHEGVEVDTQISKFNKIKEGSVQEFSKQETEKAMQELKKRMFSDQFSEFDRVEDMTTAKVKRIAYDTTIYADKSNTHSDLSEQIEQLANKSSPKENRMSKIKHKSKRNDENNDGESSEQKLEVDVTSSDSRGGKELNADNGLNEFINSIHVSKENENEKYVKEMFVTRPEDENYMDDSEDEKNEEDANNGKSMAGWGSWTGYGIEDKQENGKENEKESDREREKHKKSRVKVSKKKDPKLSKYYIHNLPHPFSNRHEYNSKMEIPVGPEWNTINMYKRLTQPKTSVKIGSVIMPLGLGNNKHKQLIRDYGKKIIKNRTHSRL